jgi:hypothetical protein
VENLAEEDGEDGGNQGFKGVMESHREENREEASGGDTERLRERDAGFWRRKTSAVGQSNKGKCQSINMGEMMSRGRVLGREKETTER